MRPTVVMTSPIYGASMTSNPHITSQSLTQYTSLPMITLRLPLQKSDKPDELKKAKNA